MGREIVPGKRTFIKRWSRAEFELPEAHTAKLVELGRLGTCLSLHTPQMGGTYRILSRDETDDRVTFDVGEEVIETGAPSFGEEVSSVRGYPFPND